MKNVKTILTKILGLFCLFLTFIFIIGIFTLESKGEKIAFSILTLVFGSIFYLLFFYHKTPTNTNPAITNSEQVQVQNNMISANTVTAQRTIGTTTQGSTNQTPPVRQHSMYPTDTPPEALKATSSVVYSLSASSIIRVIEESYIICTTTTQLETFESRLDFATSKALTLRQMEEARVYSGQPSADYFLNLLIGNRKVLLSSFLGRAYQYTVQKAHKELKTEKGIRNRIDSFFNSIESSKCDFDAEEIQRLKGMRVNSVGRILI